MKVLLVHNWYGSSAPSGENAVVQAETELLRSSGVEVIEFFRHSDDIRNLGLLGSVIGGFATPFNPVSYFKARRVIRRERPDIIHVHNFFPLISPSVFYAAAHENVAIVMTLHNYRLGCGAGLPFRENVVCMKCLDGRSIFPLLRYKCYRNSLLASIPMAIMIAMHRWLRTWERKITLYISLTEFQGAIMHRIGLVPPEALRVKPQFMINPPIVIPFEERKNRAIFIGRVSNEKGLPVLLDAWRLWGSEAPELIIIGDGPDLTQLKALYPETNLVWKGKLPPDSTLAHLQDSKLLIFPSICFEGFPMVIREALASGVPILASDIGPLGELVRPDCGQLFQVGDSNDLLARVQGLMENKTMGLAKMAIAARDEFDRKYTADRNFARLQSIYREAIDRHSLKK